METISLEEQLKTLQSNFGRIVATVKHLKSSVDNLTLKCESKNQSKEVSEMLETQKVVEEVTVANSDAINKIKTELAKMKQPYNECNDGNIEGRVPNNSEFVKEVIEKQKVIDKNILANANVAKRLDKEIKSMLKEKTEKDTSKKKLENEIKRLDVEILKLKASEETSNLNKEVVRESDDKKQKVKCRYFNIGYCKYKERCKFKHPEQICKEYVERKCNGRNCEKRHPKACKWVDSESGCHRKQSCDFSHDALVCGDKKSEVAENADQNFTCVSCKHAWKEERCVVTHYIKNMEVHFCLNCDDWVNDKNAVLVIV